MCAPNVRERLVPKLRRRAHRAAESDRRERWPRDAETAGWDERDAPEVVSPVRVRVQRREREREREDEQTKGAHGARHCE